MVAAAPVKLVVGLTGGIGSGKSAAADAFARLGATVVDTDAIAHELTEAGGPAIPLVEEAFGPGFIGPSGEMDRRRMREHVFADPAAKKRLEGLLHPLIRKESAGRIARAAGPYVIHVVPLLVESPDYRKRVNRVLVVDCPEADQVARVRSRSALTEREVLAIIAAQAPREKRLAAADDVIDNSGTLDALRDRVAVLHAGYLKMVRTNKG